LVRPALERLRDQAAAGAVDRLYVYSPDRLARNYAYQVLLLEEWQRWGVEVVFLNQPLDQSPEATLLLQVQGMVAEYERAQIMERSRRGKLHAARRGSVSVMGSAPYGYRYLRRRDNGGVACYQVREDQAEVVRQIFTWVGQERCSIAEVRRRLQERAIVSPQGEKCWSHSTVWCLLKNPAYQGMARYGKRRSGPCRPRPRPQRGHPEPRRRCSMYATRPEEQIALAVPALIEPDLFAAVAEQLQENRKRWRLRPTGARSLLQGLLVCTHCGYACCGARVGDRYGYYRCRASLGAERICPGKSVHMDRLDAAVWDDVRSLLADPERIRREYERRLQGSNHCQDSERCSARLQQAKLALARLIDAYEAGLLERSEFEPRIRQARERLQHLSTEAQAAVERSAQQRHWQEAMERFQEFAQRVADGLDEVSGETRRQIIRALVKEIELGADEVRVVYKVTPHPFVSRPQAGRILHDCPTRS
jgi:site-specific DNA recombinase